MICPVCKERVWRYDDQTWTCKNGHHTPMAGIDPSVPLEPPNWRLHAALIGGAAGTVVSVIIGVLL